MKKLFFILILSGFSNLKAQLFPIKSLEVFMPLDLSDTLFVEDLIGEGKYPSPIVLDCFVIKFSEWNYVITYKLESYEQLYVIKDGFIKNVYIYKNSGLETLKKSKK